MASGNTLASFFPSNNEPPASNYATLNTVNGELILEFDTTTQEAACFSGVLPRHYAGGGITVYLIWAAASALAFASATNFAWAAASALTLASAASFA